MFDPVFLDDLVVWCGEKSKCLEWKPLWDTGHGPETARAAWLQTFRLPTDRARRAKEKLERFLRGVNHWFPKVFQVPTDGVQCVDKVKKHIIGAVRRLRTIHGSRYMLRFVCSSLVFRKSKPGSAESELQDHYRAAGEISHEECKKIPEETRRLYDESRDMQKLPDHCGHPGTTDRKELAKSAGKQYESLLQSLGVPQTRVREMLEDLGSFVDGLKFVAGDVRRKLV